MGNYAFIPQEGKYLCVPACLQMILQSRGLPYDSQAKMFRELDGRVKDGIKLPEGKLEGYFRKKRIPLHCVDFMVNKSFCKDFDIFLDSALHKGIDVIVSYAYEKLHGTKKEANHLSLVVRRVGNDTVLRDPDRHSNGSVVVDFNKLVSAMFEKSGGYHCIHPDLEVLKSLPTW